MTLVFPLRSARLELRPFADSDLEAAHAVYGDPEVMRYVGEGVAVTREQAAAMIAEYRDHQQRHGYSCWAVVERATGTLIGDAGLSVTEHGIELGYTLGRTWWGRGLATEAGRLCTAAAAGPLALDRLLALVDADNPASVRVLENLGFRADGSLIAYGRPHRRLALELPQHASRGACAR